MDMTVTGPKHIGRKVFHRDFLDKAETFSYLKRNLALFGVHPENFADLPTFYPKIVGKSVQITLRTKNGFQAVYLNRLVQDASASSGNGVKKISSLVPF
jgi:hypothetical protein